jgi:hypothetical protein
MHTQDRHMRQSGRDQQQQRHQVREPYVHHMLLGQLPQSEAQQRTRQQAELQAQHARLSQTVLLNTQAVVPHERMPARVKQQQQRLPLLEDVCASRLQRLHQPGTLTSARAIQQQQNQQQQQEQERWEGLSRLPHVQRPHLQHLRQQGVGPVGRVERVGRGQAVPALRSSSSWTRTTRG